MEKKVMENHRKEKKSQLIFNGFCSHDLYLSTAIEIIQADVLKLRLDDSRVYRINTNTDIQY